MNLISAIANLQKAHDYYEQELKDARGVIKQLVGGPGDIEYIHPFDISEMFQRELVDVFIADKENSNAIEIAKTGKKYKITTLIPAKSKSIDRTEFSYNMCSQGVRHNDWRDGFLHDCPKTKK